MRTEIQLPMTALKYPGIVTFEEIRNAIKQRLPGIRYPAAGAMCEINPQAACSHLDAATKIWAWLIELNAKPCHRDLGPATQLT